MYPGWNLGNTLEGGGTDNVYTNNGGLGAEKAWQGTTTTQAIIDFVAAQGFKSVRIPASWVMGHIIDADELTIDPVWMARVKEIVDYCINDGLYVLLNDHWDGGWIQGTFKQDISEPTVAANCEKMKKLWTQIAEAFKDYDEHLLFAGLNEPEAEKEEQIKVLMTYEQAFIDAVRATGGNNQYRNLAVTTYAATGTSDAALEAFQAPQDVVQNHIYLTIHSYDPYNFCNNNSGKNQDGTTFDYNIKIFDDDCKAEIDRVFARIQKRCTSLGIPFIFGEFGAIDEDKSMTERVKYATYLKQKFTEYNMTGLWWMGLYNRDDDEWYEQEIVDALFK
jgi:endoglucanase